MITNKGDLLIMIDDNDLKLIEEAKQVINKNFDEVDENHTVGAALRCKNGNIIHHI
ncbi:hypothetical protein [Clostridium sp. HMP27]|uniref:hypothetical protein n=1 Tax=Clostridium sp. HMP27 TaxID=1487921 RepID=UPI0025C1A28D|nr:hypothetical protein [Clostridium sp. HMP27]